MQIIERNLSELRPYENNPRHNDSAVEAVASSIREFGFKVPVLIDGAGTIIAGHTRIKAAGRLGIETVPCILADDLTPEQARAFRLADNKVSELADWDMDLLGEELDALLGSGIDMEQFGFDISVPDDDFEPFAAGRSLQERFLIPPFSILDARTAVWRERKEAWKKIGIRSEIGRGNDGNKTKAGLTFAASSQPPSTYEAKNEYEREVGHKVSWEEFAKAHPKKMQQSGTSIFDPVLCEVAYRWFCPLGGAVLDPFAGGSVRGITAALTGRHYTGVDLSARQIEANIANWEEIGHTPIVFEKEAPAPRWLTGDSASIDTIAPGEYDLIFTCPPYADLEVYSNLREDLSTMKYPDFINAFRAIIQKSAAMLKDNRFACIVVGDVRDKKGLYRNFPADTIQAFIDAGLSLYNEAILVTSYGSLAIRVGKPFENSRKLGKTHQNVLIFCKGDPKAATEACGKAEYGADLGEDAPDDE